MFQFSNPCSQLPEMHTFVYIFSVVAVAVCLFWKYGKFPERAAKAKSEQLHNVGSEEAFVYYKPNTSLVRRLDLEDLSVLEEKL